MTQSGGPGWWVSRRGVVKGPFNEAQMGLGLSRGKLRLDDLVCRTDEEQWLPVGETYLVEHHAVSPRGGRQLQGRPESEPTAAAPGLSATDAGRTDGNARVWNPSAAVLWGLLFSPIFSSILLSLNWRALGDGSRGTRALLLGAAHAAFLLFTVATGMLLPETSPISEVVGALGIPVSLGLLVVLELLEARPQRAMLKQSRHQKRSWLPPLGIGVTSVFSCCGAIVVAALMMPSPHQVQGGAPEASQTHGALSTHYECNDPLVARCGQPRFVDGTHMTYIWATNYGHYAGRSRQDYERASRMLAEMWVAGTATGHEINESRALDLLIERNPGLSRLAPLLQVELVQREDTLVRVRTTCLTIVHDRLDDCTPTELWSATESIEPFAVAVAEWPELVAERAEPSIPPGSKQVRADSVKPIRIATDEDEVGAGGNEGTATFNELLQAIFGVDVPWGASPSDYDAAHSGVPVEPSDCLSEILIVRQHEVPSNAALPGEIAAVSFLSGEAGLFEVYLHAGGDYADVRNTLARVLGEPELDDEDLVWRDDGSVLSLRRRGGRTVVLAYVHEYEMEFRNTKAELCTPF